MLINIIAVIYTGIVIYVMNAVNQNVPEAYMDEVFHYPMTERYFNGIGLQFSINISGNFTYWDPKITTFPGLYVVGSLFTF